MISASLSSRHRDCDSLASGFRSTSEIERGKPRKPGLRLGQADVLDVPRTGFGVTPKVALWSLTFPGNDSTVPLVECHPHPTAEAVL